MKIWNRKFNEEDVKFLRENVNAENCLEIAEQYGCSWFTVAQAVRGNSYKEFNDKYPPVEIGRKKIVGGLTDKDKNLIRQRVNDGESQREVADSYAISESYVSKIMKFVR